MGNAGDAGAVLDALRSSWPRFVAEHGAVLRGLLDGIRADLWDTDPWLIACYASSYHSLGSPTRSAAMPYFTSAVQAMDDSTELPIRIAVSLHHSAALRSLGRHAEALARADTAADLAAADTSMPLAWRISLGAKAALQRGIALYHLGDYDAALPALRSAAGLATPHLFRSEQVECFSALALIAYSLGEFERSLRWASLANETAEGTGLIDSCFGVAALIAQLLIAVEQDRRDDADALWARVAVACPRSDWEAYGLYSMAAVSIISEQYVEGLELLRRCLQTYRRWPEPGVIAPISEGLRATLLLRLGETDTAWDILGSLTPTQHHANCPGRFIAHLRFITGDAPGTLAALVECEALGDSHSVRTLVDVHLLKAAAQYSLGHDAAADVAFDRALLLAVHNGMRVPFRLVPSSTMRMMLARAAERPQPPEVLALFDAVERSPGAPGGEQGEPLSAREREIVRALVRDLTANEIADELFISVNTVKSHLKSVYRKLGVSSRPAAIKRARQLGHQLEITPDSPPNHP